MLELGEVASIILGIAGVAINIIADLMGDVLKDTPLWDSSLGFTIGGLLLFFCIVCIIWFIRHIIKHRKRARIIVSQENGGQNNSSYHYS